MVAAGFLGLMTPWMGASTLALILIFGFCWWKSVGVSPVLQNRYEWLELDGALYISFVAVCVWGVFQFSPFAVFMVAPASFSKNRGMPWMAHCIAAVTLVLSLPYQIRSTGNSHGIKMKLQDLRVPFVGWQGSPIAQVYAYAVHLAYPAEVYLHSMSACIAMRVAYEYSWIMVALCFVALLIQAAFMLSRDDLISCLVLAGMPPELVGVAQGHSSEALLCIVRLFTAQLWQFILGLDLVLFFDAHWPVYIALIVSLFNAIRHMPCVMQFVWGNFAAIQARQARQLRRVRPPREPQPDIQAPPTVQIQQAPPEPQPDIQAPPTVQIQQAPPEPQPDIQAPPTVKIQQVEFDVQIPEGYGPGTFMPIEHEGMKHQVQVPDGYSVGAILKVSLQVPIAA